jgi:xanthine dehydrogenase YagR molybdenum-binding subunit
MVVAEELGLSIDRVRPIIADTESTPPAPGSGGSVTIPSVTPAIRAAAADAREKLLALAAGEMEAEAGDLTYDGTGEVRHTSGKTLPISDLIQKSGGPIEGEGIRPPPGEGKAVVSFGAQFAEVEVDVETGHVQVLKLAAAHDSGRPINRKTFENQVEGGAIQGICFALYGERVLDGETGRMVNPNLHDYRLPTMSEIPDFESIVIHNPDPHVNNTGAKGLGEPPVIPTAGAIANAVYNAIGVRITDLPITPEKVLRALKEEF